MKRILLATTHHHGGLVLRYGVGNATDFGGPPKASRVVARRPENRFRERAKRRDANLFDVCGRHLTSSHRCQRELEL
jgi:hypothetical protein